MKKPKAKTKVKPVKAWAVVDTYGQIDEGSIYYSRRDAQKQVIMWFSYENKTWRHLYREGWRVIRVQIKPI